jgi:hypothetical protein
LACFHLWLLLLHCLAQMSRHVIPRVVTMAFYVIAVVVIVGKDGLLASSPQSTLSAMTQTVVKVGHVHCLPNVQISTAAALAPPNVVHLPSPTVDTNAVSAPLPAKTFATLALPFLLNPLPPPLSLLVHPSTTTASYQWVDLRQRRSGLRHCCHYDYYYCYTYSHPS